MCRFLAYWGNAAVDLSHFLVGADNCLLKQSECDESSRPNPDGWGLGYRQNNNLNLVRSAIPAYQDKFFLAESGKVLTDLLFAHVRRKSHGPPMVENSHPFIENEWMFMHNGNIPDLQHFKDRLSGGFLKKEIIKTIGSTDSEFLFKTFFHLLNKQKNCDIKCTLEIILNIINQLYRITNPDQQHLVSLNFMLTNGKYIIGFRRNRSLYHANYRSGTLLSSENLGSDLSWKEVPENHFIILSAPENFFLLDYETANRNSLAVAEKMNSLTS